jgi:hypothetical protein
VKAKSTDERELVREAIAQHRKENSEARKALAWAMYEGITVSFVITIHIDAMDQAKSRVPITATHSAGGIMHKLQLKLTGVLVHGESKPWRIYMTEPWVKVGANITLTIFSDLFFKGVLDQKRVLYIGWDGAGDNNCNSCMYYFAFILLIAQKKGHPLQNITASRMYSGHTKFDVDQRWSNTSSYFYGNKRNGYRRRDVFTMSEFEAACIDAHKDLHEYVHLRNCIDFDSLLQPMRATSEIDSGLKTTYVVEMTTDRHDKGKVFLRTKHRMGQSVPFSERTCFFPHPKMPASRTQSVPSSDEPLILADFKRWDVNDKNRKSLAKEVGREEALEMLPPRFRTWQQKNPKVISEMTKFAAGGYSCHILTDSQKSELQTMLDNIPDTPDDIPLAKRFVLGNLWNLWDNLEAQPDTPESPLASDVDKADAAAPRVPGPEVRPVMTYGLNAAQVRARTRALIPEPIISHAPEPDPTEPDRKIARNSASEISTEQPDQNPRPLQRCRHAASAQQKRFQVGARVKMNAWRFGKQWGIKEFGLAYKTKLLDGVIVRAAGRAKWAVLWDYDSDTTVRHQKELKLIV